MNTCARSASKSQLQSVLKFVLQLASATGAGRRDQGGTTDHCRKSTSTKTETPKVAMRRSVPWSGGTGRWHWSTYTTTELLEVSMN